MQLPADLSAALEDDLGQISSREIAKASERLSERYRAGRGHAPFLRGALDVAAYIAYRLPATYAAIHAAVEEVRTRRPDLRPRTLLDAGAGPGTGAWAAVDVWPNLERITMVERDPEMIQTGKSLAARSSSPVIRNAEWRQEAVDGAWECAPADITIAAYVIGELPDEGRTDFIQRLWECSADVCVIVEPGTPAGFSLVHQAGAVLAEAGARILAPFPQGWQCLEREDDWCHFSARVPRTRMHRAIKGADLSYEDEKYAYVAASRVEGLPLAARVIRHPQVRRGHIRLVLCTAAGVRHVAVSRSSREAYRRAKDLAWGSAIPVEDAGLFGLNP